MKLEDARYQYILLPDEKLGIQDVLTGSVTEVAYYSLPSDILHISIFQSFSVQQLFSMPTITAKKMSELFKKQIIAIYLEIL